jgi:hypothetical protein
MCKDCKGITLLKGENGVGIVSITDNNDGTFTILLSNGTTYTSSKGPCCSFDVTITVLEAGITAIITGGVGPYTYQWTIADTLSAETPSRSPFMINGPSNTSSVAVVYDNTNAFYSLDVGGIGALSLLKVKVIDANGVIAKDTLLINAITLA